MEYHSRLLRAHNGVYVPAPGTSKNMSESNEEVVEPAETTEEETKVEEEVVEEGDDFYKTEAEKLRAEKTKLEADIAEKNRQLGLKDEALKKKSDKIPDAEKLKSDILTEFEQRQIKREAFKAIETTVVDKNAQELIKDAYENKIVRSGNVDDDIDAAVAYVNRKRVNELLRRESEESEQEDRVVSSQLGSGTRAGSSSVKAPTSPAYREAVRMAKMAAGGDKEKEKKLIDNITKRF
jgi:hypothetical protein